MRWSVAVFAVRVTLGGHASASGIGFDCDVPADRFSSVTGDPALPGQISGTVNVVELRKGKNLPVAGARLLSADKKQSVGFQLISNSRETFEIVLNVNDGTGLKRASVGEISAGDGISFSLAAAPSGDVTLEVDGQSYKTASVPMTLSTAMAFCSTGQFRFANLQI